MLKQCFLCLVEGGPRRFTPAPLSFLPSCPTASDPCERPVTHRPEVGGGTWLCTAALSTVNVWASSIQVCVPYGFPVRPMHLGTSMTKTLPRPGTSLRKENAPKICTNPIEVNPNPQACGNFIRTFVSRSSRTDSSAAMCRCVILLNFPLFSYPFSVFQIHLRRRLVTPSCPPPSLLLGFLWTVLPSVGLMPRGECPLC